MDNNGKKYLDKFLSTEAGKLILSIVVGILAVKIKHITGNGISSNIFDTLMVSCFTYIIINILQNPYGKFSDALKGYTSEVLNLHQSIDDMKVKVSGHEKKIENLISNFELRSSINKKGSDKSITVLLNYLSEESYGKCSNKDGSCNSCERYKKTCDGLFRSYLYQDCQKLVNAIEKVKSDNAYQLDTEIAYYHSLAIEQMMQMGSECYRVIQSMLDSAERVYDDMDEDFIKSFLDKLFKKNNDGCYAKDKNFKIKWLLLGDYKLIENNYKYLIEELNTRGQEVREIFEFKCIAPDIYSRYKEGNKIMSGTDIDSYYRGRHPSMGIFGDSFVFVDADQNEDQHGTMYANPNDIKNLVIFYNELWDNGTSISYNELKQIYDDKKKKEEK